MSDKTMLTLFAGGGLADLGARAAGYRTVAAVEYDPAVCQVFRLNHGVEPVCAKVQEVDYRPYAGVTAVWASPSCVRASVANQDGGECEEDRSAAEAVCRCLREVRPEVFCLENVWGYRNFDSLTAILDTLWRLHYRFRYDHVNSASLGVPQTRSRLLLRASRIVDPAPILPTHRQVGETGGMFGGEWGVPRWNGWYRAVEDLLPGCPESKFADWQLRRMPPELTETLLVERQGARNGPLVMRRSHEPMWTVRAVERNDEVATAYLCDGTDARLIDAARRAGCVTACLHEKMATPSAWLVGTSNSGVTDENETGRGLNARECCEPAMTVRAGANHVHRALLVSGAATTRGKGYIQREAEEPSVTLTPGNGLRAALPGRVVRLTPRCLARFQDLPDSYLLPEKAKLACSVIGNGVPPTMALAALRSAEEAR